MSKDTMTRLARANPVESPPSVRPFAYPDGEAHEQRTVLLARPAHPRHARRHGALALAAVAGAAAISLVLALGSSRSPVDVLAAVYAATAPRGGIVESVTIVRDNPGSSHQSTERLREWMQAPAGRLRAVMSMSRSRGDASVDVVYSPRTWEIWRAGATDGSLPFGRVAHDTIQRVQWTGSGPLPQERLGVGGGLVGEQWAQTFHTLYLKRQFRVAGKVSHRGRSLWKLEETPTHARARAREDQTRYYVLVDPKSFLPVYTRLIDLARPGDPTLSEVELIGLRTLPASPANEKLFDLALQHPGTRVVTKTMPAAFPSPPSRGSRTARR